MIDVMGSQKKYLESGGFSSYPYEQVGDVIRASNGVESKVVRKIDGNAFEGLPTFSNTCEVYLKQTLAKIVQNSPLFDKHIHR